MPSQGGCKMSLVEHEQYNHYINFLTTIMTLNENKECDHHQGAERPGEHCCREADAKGGDKTDFTEFHRKARNLAK